MRGHDAARILNEPLYQEAFSLVEEGIIRAMKNSGMGDESTHNRLVIALQVLDKVQKHLKEVMETGKMAEIQVNKKKFGIFG
jgi:ribosome-binding ATPase YchF (GTP1/OBG family)